jgi:hypothetical protein
MISAILSKLFPAIIIGLVLSPIAAFGFACILFARHRRYAARGPRMSGLAFALAMVGCGVAGGYLGMMLGVAMACPKEGNLCGLFGVFVTGPLAASAAILLAATAIAAKRAGPPPGPSAPPGAS